LQTGDLPLPERRARAFTTRFAEIEAPAKLEALREAVDRWRPDAIVHESCDLAAPLTAAAAGIPSVHHSFGRLIPAAAATRAAEALAPLWRGVGLEPDPWAGLYRGTYVDICPPALQEASPPDGTALQRLRPAERSRGGDRARPLVYATLGTIFNSPRLFRELLEAFAPLPCDVLVTVGSNVDPPAVEPIPPNATVHRYVPQAEILGEASVVVAHGGSGSTWGALAHGLPMVLVPQGADQFENAEAVTAAGAGLTLLPPEQSTERLRSSLTTLLSETAYADAAAEIAAEMAAMPAADEVAATLFVA
jgi:hypothetical protein